MLKPQDIMIGDYLLADGIVFGLCRVVTEEDESQMNEIKEIFVSHGETFCVFL
jgi:hypothetical protein